MKRIVLAVAAMLVLSSGALAAGSDPQLDDMARNFLSPPDSAKPWAYWWWLNGNVTKVGITRDLEEMKRQGINGVLVFQGGTTTAPPGVRFLSPEWHQLFQFVLREADRLGMEVSVNLCDGWDSGGTWITPDQANKMLVSSEFQVDGQTKLAWLLPLPAVRDNYYHDVAVLAVREKATRPVTPATVTASSTLEGFVGEWNHYPQDAVDGDPETFWSSARVPVSPDEPAWLQFDYDEPLAARAIYVNAGPDRGPQECELQSSSDGKTFSSVIRFSLEKGKGRRVEFPEVKATRFRLVIPSAYGAPVQVAEAELLRGGDEPSVRRGIKWWWFKSANRSFWDYPRQGPAALAEEYAEDGAVDCRSEEVLDLTKFMEPDGRLTWDVPQGRWTILRFGYTLGGQPVHGSSVDARRGLEADMLDRAGIVSQFEHTAEPMLADSAATGHKTLKTVHIDSYELGATMRGQQPTWSRNFRDEFKKLRGYDLLAYLPIMTGRIVDSREVTDRFLFDFRWTIGDLMAERFWIPYAELAHQHGIGVQAETGYGTYPYPHIDGLRCAGNMDLPMGEFWFGTDLITQFNSWGNVIKTVATAAHIYGRPVVQAESFTSLTRWQESPQALKPVGDQAFLEGLNRMVFSVYTMQPLLDMKPGWQFWAGTHFDRNVTWWEEARAFFLYLARCQYLLQQGRFVADALYFYGEGVTKFVPSREYLRPELPQGYSSDAINSELLLHRLSIANGQFVLPSGMSYRVLVLPEDGIVSPVVLRKVRELVMEGGVVVGPKPQRAPGLTGYPDSDAELKRLAEDIWGDCDGSTVREKHLGKGRIVCRIPLGDVLMAQEVAPDFELHGKEPDASIEFLHRTTGPADIYFLSNRKDRTEQVECVFRVRGKLPELWDPVTGETTQAGTFEQAAGRTTLPLEFAPYGSLFVVFRMSVGKDVNDSALGNYPLYHNVQEFTGPWTVSFDPKWGGPESAGFNDLVSWTMRPEDGIKYYSGTATYRKPFDLPNVLRGPQTRVALDLGEVKYIARVRLNGKDLGVVWTKPFRVEITGAAKPTGNLLEVEVVNLWPNRLIGDAALPPDRRYAHTNVSYKKDDPLLESGLLGPVRLQSIERFGR
ncbi:MAG: discoidin domain-containing protein [Acidobacteriia bacterium]|nr:discoidin domain-containing protein [Terriglobia bacterium]